MSKPVTLQDAMDRLAEWGTEEDEQLCKRIHANGDTCRHDRARAALYHLRNAAAELAHERTQNGSATGAPSPAKQQKPKRRDRVVCTRCGVISRGFVGDCPHVAQAMVDGKAELLKEVQAVVSRIHPADGVEGCGCTAEVGRQLRGLKS